MVGEMGSVVASIVPPEGSLAESVVSTWGIVVAAASVGVRVAVGLGVMLVKVGGGVIKMLGVGRISTCCGAGNRGSTVVVIRRTAAAMMAESNISLTARRKRAEATSNSKPNSASLRERRERRNEIEKIRKTRAEPRYNQLAWVVISRMMLVIGAFYFRQLIRGLASDDRKLWDQFSESAFSTPVSSVTRRGTRISPASSTSSCVVSE